MKLKQWLGQALVAAAVSSVVFAGATASAQSSQTAAAATTLSFRDVGYLHRWSKDGQHEFTPEGQSDLQAWTDMLILNVHPDVTSEQQLAGLANAVRGNYQNAGKILKTGSKPKTPDQLAEHLAVAVLGAPGLLEATFARFVLVDGVGTVVSYSHRVYDSEVGPAMNDWLKNNGAQVEGALMGWKKVPGPVALGKLPQSD
jgi:hypothetical protein